MSEHDDLIKRVQPYYNDLPVEGMKVLDELINTLLEARTTTIEECAKVAVSFGEFPGEPLIKDMRVMCGNAIADKIRELALSGDYRKDEQ